jgi:2-C-methyl-D-erythritol 4-phosphate cytidylyltransferase/2-C-methyl-D-erythritol 2,4-cyclodiphosphate synthase
MIPDIRVGSGFDVHRFSDGPGPARIGGIDVPSAHGLEAHSDGDVGLHALCDAIFGALGDGDIGAHFPPSDNRWKNADSADFLTFAVQRAAARGAIIQHLDLTLICETPKIGPHRTAMQQQIASLAGLPPERVGVKATTSEKLGFTGRGEGIAAQATATLLFQSAADGGTHGI